MFALASSRGTDASGFAYVEGGKLKVFKAPISSVKNITTKSWNQFKMPKIFIAHTRARTQGSEKVNGNNHPIFNKKGMAIIHNGMIQNEAEIYRQFSITPDNEVDSEVILRLMELKDNPDEMIKNVFDHIKGSYAVASIDRENPERLILFRSSNPIKMRFDLQDKILYFASEDDYMTKSFPKEDKYCLYGINFIKNRYEPVSFDDEHGMVIEPVGVTLYEKYKAKAISYGYSRYYEGGYKRNSYYDREYIYDDVTTTPDNPILEAQCGECGEDVSEKIYPYTVRNNTAVWCHVCKKMQPWLGVYHDHTEVFGEKDSERIYKKKDEIVKVPF